MIDTAPTLTGGCEATLCEGSLAFTGSDPLVHPVVILLRYNDEVHLQVHAQGTPDPCVSLVMTPAEFAKLVEA